ncbi:MAG: hypothetical protein GEU98_16670 [Pseudonocardiaceae bacterium]|nr:hypothetical protein [Pseudonocardiaceae bacterium]
MAFNENFIDTFRPICRNQFILLATMKNALEAHREMWRSARKDIDTIAHTTMDALGNAGGCGKNQWSFGFSVLSAVGAIISVPLAAVTGGGPLAIAAIGAVGSAGSAGAAGISASGDSAEDITNSMRQAIERLTRHIQESEAEIVRALQKTAGAVNGGKDVFVAPRPELAGMRDGELTADSGMGRSD